MYSQFKAYALTHNPMDYSQLAEALKSDRVANSKDDYLVHTFREEVKAVPQKHYTKRIEDPAQLPEWNSIKEEI